MLEPYPEPTHLPSGEMGGVRWFLPQSSVEIYRRVLARRIGHADRSLHGAITDATSKLQGFVPRLSAQRDEVAHECIADGKLAFTESQCSV